MTSARATPDGGPPPPDGGPLVAVQRRTVRVLVAAQVLVGVGTATGIAVGTLLAEEVSGSTSLAGLAQTAAVLGAALLAVPLARLASARGRRPALAAGLGTAVLGSLVVLVASALDVFPLMLVGSLLFGGGTAAGLQSRFAAADAAALTGVGRALAVVVWATTVGAVLGPNLSGPGGALGTAIGVPALAGPFAISMLAFAAAGVLVLVALRPDPLLAAREAAGAPARAPSVGTRAALTAVLAAPRARLGLVAVGSAHAVMVGVMVMTPVHLRGSHQGGTASAADVLVVVGLVISAHVAGMYAAAPLWGWLVDRRGGTTAVALGSGVLLVSLLVAVLGASSTGAVAVALVLLGLGWSGSTVAGSVLVSTGVDPAVRPSAQGATDLVMGLSGASAGALAGLVLDLAGYQGLATSAAVLVVPVLVLLASGTRSRAVRPAG